MMNATTYGVLYGVLILLLTCLQYYIRIIKPEKIARKYMQEYIELKKLEQSALYTPEEAVEKIVSELVGNEPIRFTVESIKEYQSSSSPFTDEELQDIMDDELALGEDMNTELIDYIMETLK